MVFRKRIYALCVCVCAYMSGIWCPRMYVQVCMYVCMHIYIYTYMCLQTYPHFNDNIPKHMFSYHHYTRTCIQTHTHSHVVMINIDPYTQKQMQTLTNSYIIHTYTWKRIHTQKSYIYTHPWLGKIIRHSPAYIRPCKLVCILRYFEDKSCISNCNINLKW
jgi:hypothetical protein